MRQMICKIEGRLKLDLKMHAEFEPYQQHMCNENTRNQYQH